jgi:hypothetical protein
MARQHWFWIGLFGCLFCSFSANNVNAQRTQLFFEDFEDLVLGESVDEPLFEEEVWTNVPPEGWTIENDIPEIDTEGIGVTEWKGWSFADIQWWVQTAGDQRRSEFVSGEGTAAIADPDEWDDLGDPKQYGLYNTWLKTSPISIVGVQADSLRLEFASSWRPEGFDDVDNINNQTAQITASFDGGDPVDILYWDSDSASDTYHDHFPDEEVSIDIPNPAGAKNVVLEFALLTSYNDWWWAVDNINLTGVGGGAAPGDFDANGALDATDIDELTRQSASNANVAAYDLNGDTQVNEADVKAWIKDLYKSWVGDANLDHEFSSSDLVTVLAAGAYEVDTQAVWTTGDFNGDGRANSSDLVAALADGGYELGPPPAARAVPEPCGWVLTLLGAACLLRRGRNRNG